jgi:sugar phosphate isomerase/epimerase
MFTRRDFAKAALAAIPVYRAMAAKVDSRFKGVLVGAQTYSFRDRGLDEAITAMKEIGLGECELFMGHVEPKGMRGDELKAWRVNTPDAYFQEIRKKFDDAGIEVPFYTFNFSDRMSDEELEHAFRHTKALGTNAITTSTTLTCAKRLVPLAEKAKVRVAMHGHDSQDPNQFAKPESFQKALEMSPQFYINLDIGHYVSAGYDPLAYIQEHHDKMLCLHIKDRTKAHGNLPFGMGETPIKEVLRLLRDKQWDIPANIEYEYGRQGSNTLVEVAKCYQYCKDALLS